MRPDLEPLFTKALSEENNNNKQIDDLTCVLWLQRVQNDPLLINLQNGPPGEIIGFLSHRNHVP